MSSSARPGGFFAPSSTNQDHHGGGGGIGGGGQGPPMPPPLPPPPPILNGGSGGFIGGGGGNGNGGGDADGGCDRCGDPRPHAISPKWLAAFGIALCTACRAADELVPKGVAKERYLVSDGDLAPLGTLSRENPRHKQFAPMRLYLASQVAQVAARKHGGAEGLQAARAARVTSSLEARAAKRRREQAGQEAAEKARLRLEREAEARRLELEAQAEEEEEEEGAGGGGDGGGDEGNQKKQRRRRKGASAGRSEVVVDVATGKRGRRFGEGLAVVDEDDVEEM